MEKNENSQTLLLEVLGASPPMRVLDFLIENERTSWSLIEISKNAKVGYSTLKLIIPTLLKAGLIKVDRTIGRVKLYIIVKNNGIVQKLSSLRNTINSQLVETFIN